MVVFKLDAAKPNLFNVKKTFLGGSSLVNYFNGSDLMGHKGKKLIILSPKLKKSINEYLDIISFSFRLYWIYYTIMCSLQNNLNVLQLRPQ